MVRKLSDYIFNISKGLVVAGALCIMSSLISGVATTPHLPDPRIVKEYLNRETFLDSLQRNQNYYERVKKDIGVNFEVRKEASNLESNLNSTILKIKENLTRKGRDKWIRQYIYEKEKILFEHERNYVTIPICLGILTMIVGAASAAASIIGLRIGGVTEKEK